LPQIDDLELQEPINSNKQVLTSQSDIVMEELSGDLKIFIQNQDDYIINAHYLKNLHVKILLLSY
jgi:hypothetical protein